MEMPNALSEVIQKLVKLFECRLQMSSTNVHWSLSVSGNLVGQGEINFNDVIRVSKKPHKTSSNLQSLTLTE